MMCEKIGQCRDVNNVSTGEELRRWESGRSDKHVVRCGDVEVTSNELEGGILPACTSERRGRREG